MSTKLRKFSEDDIRKMAAMIKEQSPEHYFEFKDPFWIMITTILSHRTKDEVSNLAGRNLHEKYHSAYNLSKASEEEVSKLISKVGFANVKAKRVIGAAQIVINDFEGKVPNDIDLLMKIPGIGRKTANVILSDAFAIPSIAVDTHVHRISNRIGLCNTTKPDNTEECLKKVIPQDLWLGFNPTLVEFGKTICKPITPRCSVCNITEYCNYFKKNQKKS
jgi:endonuclease-3